jgi:hypothetical protein
MQKEEWLELTSAMSGSSTQDVHSVADMDDLTESKHAGPLRQPKDGPTMFEVAERLFGRKFRSATELWRFVHTKRRNLELDRALLAAGWKRKRKPRKILLRTADRLFQGFLNRLAESNRNTQFAYFVEEVILFGSFLRREEQVTDIDLCVKYYRKTQAKLNQKILRLMRDHCVGADEAYELSLEEIGDFLTAKHPRFHISDGGTIKRFRVPHRVIYRLPDAKEFSRLLSATESQIDVRHLHEFIQKRVPTSELGVGCASPESTGRHAHAKPQIRRVPASRC